MLVNGFFFVVEGFLVAEFFQHVVHIGEGKGWVFGLLALAVGVDLLGKVADLRFLRVAIFTSILSGKMLLSKKTKNRCLLVSTVAI